MRIRVEYYALFWIYVDRKTRETVELPPGATLKDLVLKLAEINGTQFINKVIHKDTLHVSCWCLVNRKRVDSETGLGTVLHDNDEVIISSPMLVGG